jgi:ribosome biogenesis protein ENP2
MNVSTHSGVAVYSVAGTASARPLPDWLLRKRARSLKKDPEYANRVELLQDFDFPSASSCVRVSDDGNWVMSTGTYKPQIRVHHLPDLSLSYSRHTDALNVKFVLLSSDISKSLHLQSDRYLEFHKQGGLHHKLRIPRYGRDLVYNRREAEALIPAAGVNSDGQGEVYRLNLELGRFMKPYEIDVGGDDLLSAGAGSLQGGINTGSVNVAACAEESHNLQAFGTSTGTVEFWDPRCNASIGVLQLPQSTLDSTTPQVTALQFHRGGMVFAAGDSTGMTYLYDLRSPAPYQKKDQGYGFPIKNLNFLESSGSFRARTSEPMLLSADKKVIKIWNRETTKNWAWIEPAVDINDVEWCRDSGMILTANEGSQQHAFFIPQLGPAPKWCSFLDNIVEELAEDASDPHAYGNNTAGAVYDNFKFLTMPQLQTLNIDHLVGKTSLLRPYMHGYFVNQKLYEEARLITNPTIWEDERHRKIQQKIEKERESRIRGNKKVLVKQNRQLVEKILEREEKNERRKAKRLLAEGREDATATVATVAADAADAAAAPAAQTGEPKQERLTLLNDPRFAELFEDEQFVIDEDSREFAAFNPVRKPDSKKPRGLTAVEEEMNDMEAKNASSDDEEYSGSSSADVSASKSKSKKSESNGTTMREPKLKVMSGPAESKRSKSAKPQQGKRAFASGVVTSKHSITFTPGKKREVPEKVTKASGRVGRRSASGNVMRGL